MSIFWGVYLPPPQKYTSLERVVTTATGVSLTVLSLGRKNNEISKKTASNLSRDVSTCACEVTYLGLFIAEFSRTTRSSSSLNTSKGEFWVNRMERIFSIYIFFYLCLNSLSATGDEGLVQNLLSCWSVCRILPQEPSQ